MRGVATSFAFPSFENVLSNSFGIRLREEAARRPGSQSDTQLRGWTLGPKCDKCDQVQVTARYSKLTRIGKARFIA